MLKEAFERYINDDELDTFALWAFGPEYGTIDIAIDFMHAWNAIHGDDLRLHANGDMQHDIKAMSNLWMHSLHRLSKFGDV